MNLADQNAFRSLHTRNFRLYFFGQLVSFCGSWMQNIGLGWLVLDLSHENGFAVGLIFALQYIPTTILGAWGGVIADRHDKRRILIVTQLVQTASAVMLGAVTISGVVELWMVGAIAVIFGCANAFDTPSRQSFVVEMVGEDDLPNAVGLNSSMFQISRIVGPALAGITIATVGTGACFAANAVSYVAVVVALLAMRPRELHRARPVPREPHQLRDGFRHVWSTPVLRSSILLMVAIGTFAINQQVYMPLLARVTFDGGAGTLAILSSAFAVGSLVGAMSIAGRSAAPDEHFVARSGVLFGAFLALVAAAPSMETALAPLFLAGLFMMRFLATLNSLIQLSTVPAMRGRVMGIYTLTVIGSTPIGGPLIGALSQAFDVHVALGVAAGVSLLAAVAYRATVKRRHRAARAEGVGPRTMSVVPTELLQSD